MNVLDTSGWLEFYTGGGNSAFFQQPISQPDELIVPTITIFEVYRHVLRNRGEEAAIRAAGGMRSGQLVELTFQLATSAATLAHENKLAMADAIILATARQFDAVLWTQDADLKQFEGVKYRAKAK